MTTETRYHALDALRAGALLLGIALHASMSFVPGFRAVGWPIVDQSQSTTLSVLYFVAHIFRMALFFVIAGFFARLLVMKLGPRGFCEQRLRRIGLPLLAAMPLVMPLTIVPLVVAVRTHAGIGGGAYAAMRPQGGIPWGHLWFLYLLLVLDAVGITVRAFILAADPLKRIPQRADRIVQALAASRLLPLVLAVPLCLTFYLTSSWQQWDGIPSPIVGFVPNFPAVLAFGTAMLLGWFLHRRQALFDLLARDWGAYLAVAVASSAVACVLIGPEAQFRVVGMTKATRLFYAACYALAIWSWCLALAGVATKWRSRESARWRYLADASYWMYLLHVPLVWGLQVWMMDWSVPWWLKYPLIMAITLVVLLLLYRFLVRGGFVGQFLSGRRYASTVAPDTTERVPTG